jgi:hypothetical protein
VPSDWQSGGSATGGHTVYWCVIRRATNRARMEFALALRSARPRSLALMIRCVQVSVRWMVLSVGHDVYLKRPRKSSCRSCASGCRKVKARYSLQVAILFTNGGKPVNEAYTFNHKTRRSWVKKVQSWQAKHILDVQRDHCDGVTATLCQLRYARAPWGASRRRR